MIRSFAYLVSALLAGAVAFCLLLFGVLAVGLLAVTPLVVPALVGYRALSGWTARGEAALARDLLGVDPAPIRVSSGGHGYWGRARAVVADRAFWREQAYFALRCLVGWPLAVALVSLLGSGLYLVALPVYYRWVDMEVGAWRIDTFGDALLAVPVGLVVLALTALAVRPLARAWRSIAQALLGPGDAPLARPSLMLRPHALATVVADVVVLVVWRFTGGAFWPYWVIVSTAFALAAHAVLVRRGVPALRRHAELDALVAALVVLVWAGAGRGYFWPAWVALGLAIALGAHALLRQRLRIDLLQERRADAADVQESELRRIERDLHDGAQARLVALGMNLGMAEQKLAADPDAARELVVEARVGVETALRELRDLARGIHPPVLADRGLAAAVSSLADAAAIPVHVEAHLPERPPAPVETAAYFVVAEALANAAKHADATRIDVGVALRDGTLSVEVTDDGRGGADPEGAGLAGLRRRVESIDGTLRVSEGDAGGTTVRAELPCAS